MSGNLTLYDLPSKPPCRSWSGNVWKTRLLLNFKGIPYTTEWIPYTRLQDFLKAKSIEPNPPGSWSEYSVPTIKFPDGTYVMDSAAIATKLEFLHPHPSIHLNPELENEAQAAIGAAFIILVFYFAPPLIRSLVAGEDVEWFKADRARRFNMTVEQLMTDKIPDEVYAAAKPKFEECRQVLTRHKKDKGPFILGSQVSYADFYFVSTMQMFRQVDEKLFERFVQEAGPEMRELYKACEHWTKRQD